ncbi:neuronal acetylcholine receptor subunit alpha-6-like [Diadema antillarum]|uniref:neuronal acetylcholine receptor subunit alpha-6-like n=1 Tax=Diadema antillarum TaxID=105358 RepID=UPI003A8A9D7D
MSQNMKTAKLGPQDNLTATIFSQYNKHNPPSHNESTRVKMGVILRSVANLDEFEGTFSAIVWQKLFWTDPRLAWNESNFDGIDVLRLPASQLWIPDIVLYNSVAEWETLSPVHVLAYPDGIVYSIAPLSVKSSCEMNLAKYPYDVQNCTLVWGSWIHDESMISLQPFDPALDLHDLVPNPRWEVVDTSVVRHVKKYNCCIESFVDLSVSVILRRRHPDSFIASSVIAAWMILITFVIAPPSSGERIIFSAFIFISLIILSISLSGSVPSYTSTSLGRFLVFGLMMTAMITVLMAVSYGMFPRPELSIVKEGLQTTQDLLNERRRRYFRLLDLGAMIVTVVLLSIMTGALFAS